MSVRSRWLVASTAFAALLAATASEARGAEQSQTGAPPPAPTKPADQTAVSGVTVTAAPQAYRSSADAKSYSIKDDLQRGVGALADVLRNIPSVEVAPDGTVSVRGDRDVTILVDGKPSALFDGPQRGSTILSLPAGQYERVEVMTNPSAAFRPDGTGGIINLITNKAAPAGAPTRSGQVQANFGTGGRFSGGLTGASSGNGLSLTGGLNLRRRVSGTEVATTDLFNDPVTGAPSPVQNDRRFNSRGDMLSANGGADYDLSSSTRLSATLEHLQDRTVQGGDGTYRSAALSGPLDLDYDIAAFAHLHFSANSGSATYLRKMAGDDHQFSVRVSLSQNHTIVQNATDFVYSAPIQPALFQDQSIVFDVRKAELKAEYKTPLPGKAKLVAGYEGLIDEDRLGADGVAGATAASAVDVPAYRDLFKFERDVHAVYATYERAFGKFSILPGLRIEDAITTTRSPFTGVESRQDEISAYPTLHLGYELDDVSKLRLDYSRRVQRPNAFQLDPFRREVTPTGFNEGNPALQPQVTQSFEAGYEYQKKATDYQVSLYFRDNTNLFSETSQDIGGGTILTTQQNLGESRNGGVELVANRALSKQLTVNASANLFVNEADASNLGLPGTRSIATASGRATVNWQATKADYLQLSVNASGRTLTIQGYNIPFTTVNLGWRHTFSDKLAAVMTLQDPFDAYRATEVIRSSTLSERQVTTTHIRAVWFGLTYALGGASKAKSNFDFGGQ